MGASELGTLETCVLPSLNDGKLTILLGAGASASSGLPDWEKMVANLLLALKIVDDDELAETVAHLGDLVLLAEAARSALINQTSLAEEEGVDMQWLSALQNALYGEASERLQPSSMLNNAALAACLNPQNVQLATLNFDQLLERAIDNTID